MSDGNGTQPDDEKEIEGLFVFWINGVVTNVVVASGLIANILTLVVLRRPSMRSSTNCYLSALAVWDSIVLISTALLIALPVLLPTYVQLVYPYVVSYIYPIALIAQTATIWLTVAFTSERYLAVCHPLKTAGVCTVHSAKRVIAIISLLSALYNLPRWFEYRPKTAPRDPDSVDGGNETMTIVVTTSFGQDPRYQQIYYSWLYLPIMCIVPLLVLSALNAVLVLALRRSRADRKRMNVNQSRENNVTLMLIAVVAVFIVCQVPALVYNFAYALDSNLTSASFRYRILSHLRNFLVTLNSAVNFILYCAFGRKFRRVFLQTFCKQCATGSEMVVAGKRNRSSASTQQLHSCVDTRQNTAMVSFAMTENRTTNCNLRCSAISSATTNKKVSNL